MNSSAALDDNDVTDDLSYENFTFEELVSARAAIRAGMDRESAESLLVKAWEARPALVNGADPERYYWCILVVLAHDAGKSSGSD